MDSDENRLNTVAYLANKALMCKTLGAYKTFLVIANAHTYCNNLCIVHKLILVLVLLTLPGINSLTASRNILQSS